MNLKLTGFWDGIGGKVSFIGNENEAKKIYNTLISNAKNSGLLENQIFYISYPLIQEEIDNFMIDGFDHWIKNIKF